MANSNGNGDLSENSLPKHSVLPDRKLADITEVTKEVPIFTSSHLVPHNFLTNSGTYLDPLCKFSSHKTLQEAFINSGCNGDDYQPIDARKYSTRTMPSSKINNFYTTEEDVHSWLKDMEEAQHDIFDQLGVLEAEITVIIEELTTINKKHKNSKHCLGQIAELLGHALQENLGK